MSAHFVALIPKEPHARLGAEILEQLKTTLAQFCETAEARAKDFGNRLQFIDSGENFEHIRCPHCAADVDTDWWGKRMDHAWDTDDGFHMCDFKMPCCDANSTLEGLVYTPLQGFATWFVSARNPGRGPLTDTEHATLDKLAGIPLQAIYQTY